jgi:hypothetical protein
MKVNLLATVLATSSFIAPACATEVCQQTNNPHSFTHPQRMIKKQDLELNFAKALSLVTKEQEDMTRAVKNSLITAREEAELRQAIANSLMTKEQEDIHQAIQNSLVTKEQEDMTRAVKNSLITVREEAELRQAIANSLMTKEQEDIRQATLNSISTAQKEKLAREISKLKPEMNRYVGKPITLKPELKAKKVQFNEFPQVIHYNPVHPIITVKEQSGLSADKKQFTVKPILGYYTGKSLGAKPNQKMISVKKFPSTKEFYSQFGEKNPNMTNNSLDNHAKRIQSSAIESHKQVLLNQQSKIQKNDFPLISKKVSKLISFWDKK